MYILFHFSVLFFCTNKVPKVQYPLCCDLVSSVWGPAADPPKKVKLGDAVLVVLFDLAWRTGRAFHATRTIAAALDSPGWRSGPSAAEWMGPPLPGDPKQSEVFQQFWL